MTPRYIAVTATIAAGSTIAMGDADTHARRQALLDRAAQRNADTSLVSAAYAVVTAHNALKWRARGGAEEEASYHDDMAAALASLREVVKRQDLP